eukprot:CAMPEP_0167761910 /NCGR_PEP_ID=MMETSP0110_2-20121227/12446_1 /TAXON_ID=629695 /ORGANISM="Gymnochlora sp., Strain CCMP2014" /LENGTH=227 /DNA_ID=CAMNT_0007648669 /DNA_START=389 /DNA_END=1072 /DNA_ORIENTATION=-
MEDEAIIDALGDPWIGASPPHGVLPIANILSMMGVNLLSRSFVGGGASIVKYSPLLRYMSLLGGMVDVSAGSIKKTNDKGICVGIVPDGIAGMFETCDDAEVVLLKKRMGLAKYALKNGATLIPAYSFGNTEIYTPWFDKFGFMKALSRKLRMSILFFYGRFGLPIPHRANVTLICGIPIKVQQISPENIEQKDIEEVHEKLLKAIKTMFDKHKGALGRGNREIRFI